MRYFCCNNYIYIKKVIKSWEKVLGHMNSVVKRHENIKQK